MALRSPILATYECNNKARNIIKNMFSFRKHATKGCVAKAKMIRDLSGFLTLLGTVPYDTETWWSTACVCQGAMCWKPELPLAGVIFGA